MSDFECFELNEFVEFYRWFYMKVNYPLFCRIIDKPLEDAWAIEKWGRAKNFAVFALESTETARIIWNHWQNQEAEDRAMKR
jgi:hypothetical protein